MKKAVALFIFIIVLGTTLGSYSAHAASKSGYTIKVGKEISIDTSIKNATWGSDDTAIATVTQNGVVKGVSAGNCTIVATANGKSELFTVKVMPSKKSNIVEITQVGDRYSRALAFKRAPVVYIDGNKLTFFETTYSELVKELKESGCSVSCEYGVNDIVAYDFRVEVMKGKALYAVLYFKVTDSMIAKDAVVFRAQLKTIKSGFYFFNSSFKPKNMPLFEEFISSDLFSEKLSWEFSENSSDGEREIVCWCEMIYNDNSYLFSFSFNSSTHKCISVQLL